MLKTIRKVLGLFEPGEYKELVALLFAMILSGLLQTAGIASVMPFFALVSNPSVLTENEALAWAFEAFGFESRRQFLIALGAFFVVMMVVSNLFASLTLWATVRIQWRSHERISQRLLERYLRAPYTFHLNQNSARLGKTVLEEVNRVIEKVFIPFSRLLARGISSLFIVILLVWADPLLAVLVSATIGTFYAAVYTAVRRKQNALGAQETAAKTERFKVTNEAFGGIKDLKVLGRESYFLTRFRAPSERYSRAHALNALVGMLPKFALEALAYGGVVVVILYLLFTRESLDQIFPLLAVYAFGANRLIPGVQDMFQSLTLVRFHAPALEELHADLRGTADPLLGPPAPAPEPPRTSIVPLRAERAIRLEDVTFTYPGAHEPALRDLSLEIPIHQRTAFVGPTGGGKTTLIDLLLGLFEPTQGRILIDDVELNEQTLAAWRARIGYVPQSIFLSDASITRNIAFGVPDELVDMEAVTRAARAAHLDTFVTSLPHGYETLVGERGVRLSGGQRQRIGIARALYHNPDILILDEATSALDSVTEDVVMQAISELGRNRTIIMIAHRLTTVQACDRIYVLERGRVSAQGTYAELVESNTAFRALAKA